MSGCTPIIPAPTVERVVIPIAKDSSRIYHYRVRSGDTLYAISRLHGIPVDQIAKMNDIAAPYVIYPGQRLVVDRERVASDSTLKAGSLDSNPSKKSGLELPNDSSSQSGRNSQTASSKVKVIKLPRPSITKEVSTSTASKPAAKTQQASILQEWSASKSTNTENESSRKSTPNSSTSTEKESVSANTRSTPSSPRKEAPKPSINESSSSPSVGKSPQESDHVVSSQNEPTEENTDSFIARTEPSDAPLNPTSTTDIETLPKGWSWPVAASPTNSFGKDDGLNYFLNQGKKVLAAASGRVTYAGVALGDFKYMVLIKTPDEYVIQYDFNVDLTVQENDLVSKGQDLVTIANSNKTPNDATSDEYRKVFFAIWRKGVPQNPNTLIEKATSGEI